MEKEPALINNGTVVFAGVPSLFMMGVSAILYFFKHQDGLPSEIGFWAFFCSFGTGICCYLIHRFMVRLKLGERK